MNPVVMVDKYKKLNKIGSGTFGEAWLVSSICSGRSYVIKEVRVNDLTEEDLTNTQREATVLARCRHINIIRYKENFLRSSPLTMCLVMEYADGGDLFDKEKEAKRLAMLIPEYNIMHWFIQVVFAVHYLHTNNILHRDLKTQNIFLTRSGIVKVGDFGIARFLRTKQELATTAIGTPYYLSPEICQRKPYNHRSDMWALGCILYELCALKHPFEADDFQSLVVKILVGEFKPVSRQYSSLVHDLIAVLLRTNPESRPTADQLLMVPQLRNLVENYIQFFQRQHQYMSHKTPSCSSDSGELALAEESANSSSGVSVDSGSSAGSTSTGSSSTGSSASGSSASGSSASGSSSSGSSSSESVGSNKSLDKYLKSLKSLRTIQDSLQGCKGAVDAFSSPIKVKEAGYNNNSISNQTPPIDASRRRVRRDSETQTPKHWPQQKNNSEQKKHQVTPVNNSPTSFREPSKLYPRNLPDLLTLEEYREKKLLTSKIEPNTESATEVDSEFMFPKPLKSTQQRKKKTIDGCIKVSPFLSNGNFQNSTGSGLESPPVKFASEALNLRKGSPTCQPRLKAEHIISSDKVTCLELGKTYTLQQK